MMKRSEKERVRLIVEALCRELHIPRRDREDRYKHYDRYIAQTVVGPYHFALFHKLVPNKLGRVKQGDLPEIVGHFPNAKQQTRTGTMLHGKRIKYGGVCDWPQLTLSEFEGFERWLRQIALKDQVDKRPQLDTLGTSMIDLSPASIEPGSAMPKASTSRTSAYEKRLCDQGGVILRLRLSPRLVEVLDRLRAPTGISRTAVVLGLIERAK